MRVVNFEALYEPYGDLHLSIRQNLENRMAPILRKYTYWIYITIQNSILDAAHERGLRIYSYEITEEADHIYEVKINGKLKIKLELKDGEGNQESGGASGQSHGHTESAGVSAQI